jgi:uncharacterized membrane protein YhaH (DUF805 family)
MQFINQFTNYVLTPFKQWKDYTSETTIKDFWLGLLSMFVIVFLLAFVLNEMQMNASETVKLVLGVVFAFFLLYCLIAFYALQARRLNNRNTSKWWLLLAPLSGLTMIASAFTGIDVLLSLAILVRFIAGICFLYLMCSNKD